MSTPRSIAPRNEVDPRFSAEPGEPSSFNAEISDEGAYLRYDLPASDFIRAAEQRQHGFTIRSLAVGLFIGILVCICNTYFALQTGWGSGMSMPSALLGFAMFRIASRFLNRPFSPAENVLIQTIAGAAGTICLAGGFTGVFPAIEFLLKPSEGSPIDLNIARLMLWSLGITFVGSVFAAFLRSQIILREKLRFPSGTATALLIAVLHGIGTAKVREEQAEVVHMDQEAESLLHDDAGDQDVSAVSHGYIKYLHAEPSTQTTEPTSNILDQSGEKYLYFLVGALVISAVFTFVSYFVPQIRRLPILGQYLASRWLWALDPSPAYIGQGMIMGPTTTLHVFLGAIIAWAFLSPLASSQGWAPGPIDDLEHGPKGWVIWIALVVLLADSIFSLSWQLVLLFPVNLIRNASILWHAQHKDIVHESSNGGARQHTPSQQPSSSINHESQELFFSRRTKSVYFVVAIAFAVICAQAAFRFYLNVLITFLALSFSLLAAYMAVRSLGETDFLPNSGLAKLAQLVFSVVAPMSKRPAIVTNLLAGLISESSSEQAGDLMQDFKTAHLLNASAKDQFYGQLIGTLFGAIISPLFYRLYTSVYEIPSTLFQIPSAHLWILTARLLTGHGLPPGVPQIGLTFGLAFFSIAALRLYISRYPSTQFQHWKALIPSGIAVAIGMYTTPAFSLPRAIGGLLNWLYLKRYPKRDTTVIVIASGLILGEGVTSILNLCMASSGVGHL